MKSIDPHDMPAAPLRSLNMGGDFLRRLESLAIAANRQAVTGSIATRAGSIRGGRVEFLEHKGYVEGDDVRDLDWNAFARTDEPVIKVFGAEREKQVAVLLDLSPSMDALPGKALFAFRLAAAVAHVALAAGDTLRMHLPDRAEETSPLRGPAASRDIVGWLERVPMGEAVNWPVAVERMLAAPRPPGACVIVSDFWCEDPVRDFAPLARHRQDLTLLHVLTPEELSPALSGNVRLEDAETGEAASLSLTPRDLDAYRAEVENHLDKLQEACRRHRARHILCRTDAPFEHAALTLLRQGGLLR